MFDDVSANIPCHTINASDSFLASNSDALIDFIKAIEEANEIILADPTADNIQRDYYERKNRGSNRTCNARYSRNVRRTVGDRLRA